MVAVVLRAIPLALSLGHPGRLETDDSADYLYLSDHLEAAYGGDEGTTAFDLGLLRTPGYPLLLRGIWELAGHHPHVVGLVQIAFACIAIVALHRAATLLDSPAAGGIAALLIAVDPTAAIFSDLVLSEATFMLMIALAILAFVRVAQAPTLGRAAVLGGVLGASVLVRPVSQYLIVMLAVALVMAAMSVGVARMSVLWLLVVFLGAAPRTGCVGRAQPVGDRRARRLDRRLVHAALLRRRADPGVVGRHRLPDGPREARSRRGG